MLFSYSSYFYFLFLFLFSFFFVSIFFFSDYLNCVLVRKRQKEHDLKRATDYLINNLERFFFFFFFWILCFSFEKLIF